tara:strand:+ start:611 stop:853 length:243 start_codon:yes stop_codon:yes gene_type:complete
MGKGGTGKIQLTPPFLSPIIWGEKSFIMDQYKIRIADALERIATALESGTITINMVHGHIENIDHAHIDDGELDIHTKSF